MASRGLLGALGGLGAGISQFASTMFNVQIEKDREARLQAIADKNYARSRADQLADTASQREFQKGLLKDERAYQDQVRSTEFGQQVTLQTLSEAQQRRLIEYGQQFPQSQLGKLIQERDRFEPGSDQYNLYQQQINQSQLIQNTNPYTGAISIGIPQFDGSGKLTGVEEVATFGGMDDLSGASDSGPPAGRTRPELQQPEIDQDALQQRIDEVEGMQADENGMIDLGDGPVKKQDALRRLRARQVAVASAGSTSRLGFSYMG